MLLEEVWRLFVCDVFPVPSTPTLFNPYRDRHEDLDRPNAPQIRQANLRRYLACFEERPPVLVMAEAPGPWGCRFSGVPLVSERQLADATFPVQGHPSSLHEVPHREYSAGIYWRVLRPYFPRFFTWNSVPFHPHQAGEPLSIRTPRSREVAACLGLVSGLVEVLRPACILAVGRKAEDAFRRIGVACRYVRHPSQGGATSFAAGMQTAFQDLKLST